MIDSYKNRLKAMIENVYLYEAILKLNREYLDDMIAYNLESGVTTTPNGTIKQIKKVMTDAEDY